MKAQGGLDRYGLPRLEDSVAGGVYGKRGWADGAAMMAAREREHDRRRRDGDEAPVETETSP